MRPNVVRLLPVGAALTLLLVGCGEPERVEARLLDYTLLDGTTFQVYVDACNANARLKDVQETPTEVRLLVTADAPGGDDCADSVPVPLKAPLGSRAVVDASTGQPVPSQQD